jgi:hypothetical protein
LAFFGALGFAAIDYWLNREEEEFSDVILDKLYYFGAISLGWLSHLFADFGFTKYNDREGTILSLTSKQLYAFDNIMGLLVAVILGTIIWFEIKDKPKQDQAVGRLYRLQKPPSEIS